MSFYETNPNLSETEYRDPTAKPMDRGGRGGQSRCWVTANDLRFGGPWGVRVEFIDENGGGPGVCLPQTPAGEALYPLFDGALLVRLHYGRSQMVGNEGRAATFLISGLRLRSKPGNKVEPAASARGVGLGNRRTDQPDAA